MDERETADTMPRIENRKELVRHIEMNVPMAVQGQEHVTEQPIDNSSIKESTNKKTTGIKTGTRSSAREVKSNKTNRMKKSIARRTEHEQEVQPGQRDAKEGMIPIRVKKRQ